jgi:hypothetical protein
MIFGTTFDDFVTRTMKKQGKHNSKSIEHVCILQLEKNVVVPKYGVVFNNHVCDIVVHSPQLSNNKGVRSRSTLYPQSYEGIQFAHP